MPHKIVSEELALLQQVNDLLDEFPTAPGPSESSVVAELERLREMLREGEKTEDQAALLQQWDRQTALLQQLRTSRQAPQVDRESPYFAHLRLREGRAERNILLGKATRLQRGIHIVDWRNAPISRIFYRYQQGDEYEEEIAERTLSGEVVARRTVAIRSKVLQRIETPEGVFVTDGRQPDGWRQLQLEPARLAGGEGSALRAHEPGEASHRRLGT
ncbi:MAG: DNA helicase UvrD, partial [Deltaproteobacteria bacterium]|nr:DNA helicase UvrD [Deltaproteobacteria bacterium]